MSRFALGHRLLVRRLLQPEKLIPADGVYFVRVDVGLLQLYGMMNIGYRPTFGSKPQHVVEVNIFDFEEDLYGRKLGIHFLRRLRAEQNFSSKEELTLQLHRDREECTKYGASPQITQIH